MRELRHNNLIFFSEDPENTHIGRLVARQMLTLDYKYADVARRGGFNDGNNVIMIVSGRRRDPYFSSIVKLSKALDLKLEKFIEEK